MIALIEMIGFLGPESLIGKGGLVLVAAIVFAESGLLIGFFLPGDSLLFITGVMTATNAEGLPSIWLVVPVVVLSAIVGDQVGYAFGCRVGPTLSARPRSRWFNPHHVVRAETFFEQHGAKAIVLARFVPVVRTFAPIVAGIGTMRYPTFLTYNIFGGVLWGAGVTLIGYFFGDTRVVRDNFELAIVAVIGISLLPVVLELARNRNLTIVGDVIDRSPVVELGVGSEDHE